MPKFTDPYAKMGDFKPIKDRLQELGFCAPHCVKCEDELYKLVSFADGSNLLLRKIQETTDHALALYDALEGKIFFNKQWVGHTAEDVLAMFGTQFSHDEISIVHPDLMRELVFKKEFRGMFDKKEEQDGEEQSVQQGV